MAEVKLPVVGGVSKKALAIGGIGSAAVVALIYIRKRKTAAAPAATGTDTSGQGQITGYDANGNPVYGDGSTSDYVDPGLQDTSQGPTYGQTGYYDPNTGQWVYGNTGTGQAAATTDAAWAQLAEQYLIQNAGADPAAVSAAIGKYITGQAVTSDQESLIDQAIAVEGYPPAGGPAGYPPGIRTQASGGQGGGGLGGGSGGGSGSGSHAAGAISNLQAYSVTRSGFTVRWNPATGAHGYAYGITQLNGGTVRRGNTSGTSVSVSGLHPGWTYNVAVQALPGGPGDNVHVALPKK